MWLAVTFLLGLGFIGMEIKEFHHMILDGNGPRAQRISFGIFHPGGHPWRPRDLRPDLDGGHDGPGRRQGLDHAGQSRLMRLSMFWHFLDIVWIGVFTIVYLMGVM